MRDLGFDREYEITLLVSLWTGSLKLSFLMLMKLSTSAAKIVGLFLTALSFQLIPTQKKNGIVQVLSPSNEEAHAYSWTLIPLSVTQSTSNRALLGTIIMAFKVNSPSFDLYCDNFNKVTS